MDTLNLSKYTDEIANIIVNSLTEKEIEFYAEVFQIYSFQGINKTQQIICEFPINNNRIPQKTLYSSVLKSIR